MHNKRLLESFSWLVAGLLWLVGASAAEDDFLQPDQAFRISGAADGPEAVRVEWDIVDGYYLYRDKLKFVSDTHGVELQEAELPPALTRHDEFFGDVPIYRDRVSIRLPVLRTAEAPDVLTLKATSQGCADQGFCYPPHTQTILLKLAELASSPPIAEEAAPVPNIAQSKNPMAALQALQSLNRELGLGGEDELLDPEDAYRFSADVETPSLLRLHWQIAKGTYLYKDKLRIRIDDGSGVALGGLELPPAKIKHDTVKPDGSIGDIEVYVSEIDLPVPLVRATPEATEIGLAVDYQGCAEIGVCYPPITKKVRLALPAAEEIAAVAPEPAQVAISGTSDVAPVSEQDRLARIIAEGSLWLVVVTFFGAGLLLAFTPCVFPMIPILSGIIAGQGRYITPRKAFWLSLVYVVAMAAAYTLAGVLAGLFGKNLQVWFQDPWILSSFAAVFVLLALSMFGFFELQLPSALQSRLAEISNRQEGGTFVGVAIMGLLSALIVGPCVAPPLAAALIVIGQTGDAVLGGMALFALSLGMGAPLIAIGTSAGKLLPRAGAWMDIVKAVFGVLLLGVAIFLLERVVSASIAMLLWGSLLIVSAVYLGAFKPLSVEASGWSRFWKGVGVVLLAYGVLMLVGAAAGGKDTLQPLRGLALTGGAAEEGSLRFQRIKTVEDLERAVASASAAGRPAMLDFYADWCISCKEMERYTFSDPAVRRALAKAVLLQADVTANDADDQALLQGHFGLPGPPAIMFFGTDGKERPSFRVVGFMGAAEFAAHVGRALR